MLKLTLDQTARMMAIIRTLLDFARKDEKKFCNTKINKVIRNCLVIRQKQMESDNNIIVRLDLCPGLSVFGNKFQFEQVQINLIVNAEDAIL